MSGRPERHVTDERRVLRSRSREPKPKQHQAETAARAALRTKSPTHASETTLHVPSSGGSAGGHGLSVHPGSFPPVTKASKSSQAAASAAARRASIQKAGGMWLAVLWLSNAW